MKEEFLYYIWQFRLLKPGRIFLESGEEITIINPGEKNDNAGPDFFNARIRIGNTLWAGNVEIHINASDWFLHRHSSDNNYDNIILHVVYNNDKDIHDKRGSLVPTLVIKTLFDENKYNYYHYLQKAKTKIPCEKSFTEVPDIIVSSWLERILPERLEKKTGELTKNLNKTKNNWDEVFYISLARSLGFSINSAPMELLAKSLPLSIISKHKNNLVQIEALLFGQAGLLEKKLTDVYYHTLQKEYNFLKNKYSLVPIPGHLWKFLRLRPANFPTIRIAQLSVILYSKDKMLSFLKDCNSIKEVSSLFQSSTSPYWKTHYHFGKISVKKDKRIGVKGIHQIIINTVAPILFIYGKQRGIDGLYDKALRWLEECPAEENNITGYWKKTGAKCINAWQSQALIELKKEYCDRKKCLQCSIGNYLFKIK